MAEELKRGDIVKLGSYWGVVAHVAVKPMGFPTRSIWTFEDTLVDIFMEPDGWAPNIPADLRTLRLISDRNAPDPVLVKSTAYLLTA